MGISAPKNEIKIFKWTFNRPWADRTAGPHFILVEKILAARTMAVRSA